MAAGYYIESIDPLPYSMLARLVSETIPAPVAWCLVGLLKLKAKLGFPNSSPYATHWQEELVLDDRADMSPHALAQWAPQIEQLFDLGFHELGYFKSDLIGAKEEAFAMYLDQSGRCLALLTWVRILGVGGIEESTPVEFRSIAQDDREILTLVVKRQYAALAGFLSPDYAELLCLPERTALKEAYRQHCDRLPETVFANSPETAIMRYAQQRIRLFRDLVDRSVLRSATLANLESIRRFSLESNPESSE